MLEKDFYTQLNDGSKYLLLGQNYLRLETGVDSFLSVVLDKYGKRNGEQPYYSQMFQGNARNDIEEAVYWMENRCDHLPPPDWLSTVTRLNWNGVYTSAIDTIWLATFKSEWRTLQKLADKKLKFPNPRDEANLLCTFLFGYVGTTDETERPPLTAFELNKRRMGAATEFMNRLPEIINPLGTLIIEGYAGRRDWLTTDMLLPILDDIRAKPTHIFSVDDELAEELKSDDVVVRLCDQGRLILHSESLAACINAGISKLTVDVPPASQAHGRQISIGYLEEGSITVPPGIWSQVSRVATILDDLITSEGFEPPLSKDREYKEFRRFLSEASTLPCWQGYKRGFAFERDFENKLYETVNRQLVKHRDTSNPIIVHGQTGTGKTVSLRALAYKIRSEKKYPVLFIESRTYYSPSNTATIQDRVNMFCEWAESEGVRSEGDEDGAIRKGVTCTLVIWDGMVDIDQYSELVKSLAARGRRVVVVGSFYKLKLEKEEKRKRNYILFEAQDRLSDRINPATNKIEVSRFDEFLNRFNLSIYPLRKGALDETFLVSLWRLVAETRPSIRTGVLREISSFERGWTRAVKEGGLGLLMKTVLGQKLYDAGYASNEMFVPTDEMVDAASEKISEVEKFIHLVMVPGSLGLNVPLELLLRALGKNDSIDFIGLLDRFDIVRYIPDDFGNYAVGPRTRLEAWLIRASRAGGALSEVKYMQNLLMEIKDTEDPSNNPELQFAIDLLRAVRPNRAVNDSYAAGKRYIEYFNLLAETLGDLRIKRSIRNPRLMLQEATLWRKYVIGKSNKESENRDKDLDAEILLDDVTLLKESEEVLEKAEAVATEALELMDEGNWNKKLQCSILVELTTNLGTKMTNILRQGSRQQEARDLFQRIHEEVLRARVLDRQNFYPIDVFSWVTDHYVRDSKDLSAEELADAEASILHLFEMTDPDDFSFDQVERLWNRHDEIGKAFKKSSLSEKALRELQEMGSKVGYYIQAFNMAGYKAGDHINSDKRIDDERKAKCRQAVDFLEANRKEITDDGRCLYLLLRLWWTARTGLPILHGEQRQTLPFSQQEWQYCFNLLIALINSDVTYDTPSINYLLGLAAFHLGEIPHALELFKYVASIAETMLGGRRIKYTYLASKANGEYEVYEGLVREKDSQRDSEKGLVRVGKLHIDVPFIKEEFERKGFDVHRGRNLQFKLAFNFLGPIADPIERH